MLQGDVQASQWVQRVLHDDRRSAPRPHAPGAPGLDLHWCHLPGGEVALSSDEPGGEHTSTTTLTGFEMTREPVSNAQYDRFVAAGGYDDERYWTVHGWRHRRSAGWDGPATTDELDRAPDAPVTGVSWWEAMAFACWADAVLPSEAQWELAARHSGPPSSTVLDLRERATRPASPFGCLDMNGHIAEWCLDNDVPLAAAPGDRARLDPVHESSETAPHAARGGCGLHDASALCGNSRDHYAPGMRDNLIGFRLVRVVRRPQPTVKVVAMPSR